MSKQRIIVSAVVTLLMGYIAQAVQPDANGAFSLHWSHVVMGSFNLQIFNPNSRVELTNQDRLSVIQNKTDQYEVRVFTQNYRAKINRKWVVC